MQIDYLKSDDGRVHAINCSSSDGALDIGILCLIACTETTIRITDEHHRFIVEVPREFRSSSERVKAFNASLTILSHEQV